MDIGEGERGEDDSRSVLPAVQELGDCGDSWWTELTAAELDVATVDDGAAAAVGEGDCEADSGARLGGVGLDVDGVAPEVTDVCRLHDVS